MLTRHHFQNIPTDTWETRDIALWAAEAMIRHEATCAQRWGVLIKLMWAVLGGIGFIILTVTSGYIGDAISSLHRLHGG